MRGKLIHVMRFGFYGGGGMAECGLRLGMRNLNVAWVGSATRLLEYKRAETCRACRRWAKREMENNKEE